MNEAKTIFLVDDDQVILDFLRAVLQKQEYSTLLARDGEQAIDLAIQRAPELVILDLTLPRLSGLQVCRELRTWYSSPILILSGDSDENMIVEALDSGADDYLTKPVRPRELLARLRSLLRRSSEKPAELPFWNVGDIEIDRAKRHVFLAGEEIKFTRTEFDILSCLVQNLDCVVTLKTLMEKIWGTTRGDYAQTLRVHIGHIRKKIEPDPSSPTYSYGIRHRLSFHEPQRVPGHRRKILARTELP